MAQVRPERALEAVLGDWSFASLTQNTGRREMIYLYITKTSLLMSGKERGDDKREKGKKVSKLLQAFPGSSVVKNPPENAGDTGLVSGPGRSYMLQTTKPVLRTKEPQLLKPMHL